MSKRKGLVIVLLLVVLLAGCTIPEDSNINGELDVLVVNESHHEVTKNTDTYKFNSTITVNDTATASGNGSVAVNEERYIVADTEAHGAYEGYQANNTQVRDNDNWENRTVWIGPDLLDVGLEQYDNARVGGILDGLDDSEDTPINITADTDGEDVTDVEKYVLDTVIQTSDEVDENSSWKETGAIYKTDIDTLMIDEITIEGEVETSDNQTVSVVYETTVSEQNETIDIPK